ncbi:hypothetical protein RO3G_10155 [Rhizopus delemar RA 99-880]|uniref:Histone deacetylase interacting domain-containing protein n=1 Tax=Rhizopus delemar (strain RA 99-880 / ATCC MYA-4621 / FGSC 9543 / NRRL 43880) TaxID=246409 RepID=I1CAG5_RHIO9|nr:hypothetical protein RO3G_10155 [Rhizopus delemar RA 99-880]|eukprot:EIE85445.1 hypothetical protein RO3G_10155 [Rhizopus delemar RA 99-880]
MSNKISAPVNSTTDTTSSLSKSFSSVNSISDQRSSFSDPSSMVEVNYLPHPSNLIMYEDSYSSIPATQQQQQPSLSPSNNHRPLNVVDALGYLDQVKSCFADQPNVYNEFLDIMKDFKSQAIDTPGVIDRVSHLFKGHPILVSGFNTFLPAGYHIECSKENPMKIITSNPYSINEARPPVEFNQAISYVNRIKTRFSQKPEVYKQFLDILHTYQKDLKPIREVYTNIQYLFAGHDDLLEDFKQFLPEVQEPRGFKRVMKTQASSIHTKKRKTYMTKKIKQQQQLQQQMQQTQQIQEQPPDPPFDPVRPSVSAEEIDLFDRIKKHIGNKPSYDEFLKIINLYTLHILNADQLIQQVGSFLDQDTLNSLQQLIEYEPKDKPVEIPHHPPVKPDLNDCEAVEDSPSYRIVPKEWQTQPCSGRDALCFEVLNDIYVSHPRWATDDSVFIGSKRNFYEDAMHRNEEERYDFDVNIDANQNVIALLEPIAQKIEKMTDEEKNTFRLEPGLGGETISIYERIIKKIYGKERGEELVDLIYTSPAAVIPTLLTRLKQKDSEWKKAQKEWNKQWREQDLKNYYKSLDYQCNSFKSNDRKVLSVKSMIAEVEMQKQFTFQPTDFVILKDVVHLTLYYLQRQHSFTKHDQKRIRHFLYTFIPAFFHFKPNVFENQFKETDSETQSDEPSEELSEEQILAGHESGSETQTSVKETNAEQDSVAKSLQFDIIERKLDEDKFFCNVQFYSFFRTFQILYERLYKLKYINDNYPERLKKTLNKTAVDLSLYSNRFDDIDLSNGHYNALVRMIERFIDGDLDQATFEENIQTIVLDKNSNQLMKSNMESADESPERCL